MKIMVLTQLKDKVLSGGEVTAPEAMSLLEADYRQLLDAAAEITAAFGSRRFDSCSIINARSGSCPEDCKWCAQSRHYSTGCETYALVDRQECLEMARRFDRRGVGRFSLVASGRRMTGKALDEICSMARDIRRETSIMTCASLGLLGKDELRKLKESGVNRYHCNLESAPSHFPTLCTTHSIDDKMATIRAARELGMEVCSGGIIGMGETAEQRVEFALKLREVEPVSIPINILCPIPGTPLASMTPLTDEEILTTIAIFRFVHPKAQLRFAGGRAKLSKEGQFEALRVGINGAIMGDMLTTVGSQIDEDLALIARAGYTL